MDGYTSPGEDLFAALQAELLHADADYTRKASAALADPAWTWGQLPTHVKAIFGKAAIRFLSE